MSDFDEIIKEIRKQRSEEMAPKISTEQLYLNQERARMANYKKKMEGLEK